MQFCREYCTLTIAGHTHHLKEFRLGNSSTEQVRPKNLSFTLQKVDNPAAVYYDIYSEIFTTRKEIENVLAVKGLVKDDQNEPDLLIDFDYETRYKIDVVPYYHECEPFSFYLQGESDFKYWKIGAWDGKEKVFM